MHHPATFCNLDRDQGDKTGFKGGRPARSEKWWQTETQKLSPEIRLPMPESWFFIHFLNDIFFKSAFSWHQTTKKKDAAENREHQDLKKKMLWKGLGKNIWGFNLAIFRNWWLLLTSPGISLASLTNAFYMFVFIWRITSYMDLSETLVSHVIGQKEWSWDSYPTLRPVPWAVSEHALLWGPATFPFKPPPIVNKLFISLGSHLLPRCSPHIPRVSGLRKR